MARHSVAILTILLSLFLYQCSKPKSKGDHAPRAGEPTDDGKVEQEPSTDGGGGTETGGGSNVGNGGSGIVCRTGTTITRIELFDFYEAKILRGWEPSLAFTPDQSKTIFEQALDTAQYMVDTRWKSTDPVMATYLTEPLKTLPSEIIFVDQPMPLQDDVAAVINAPTDCRREQIVIASEPHLAQKRYTVRKEYFEHPNFSNLDRAGLLLHELLYRLTSSNGAKTSRGARYINAVLFADKQNETLTPLKHYFEVMKDAEFPWGGAHGVPVYLRSEYRFREIEGDEASSLENGFVVPGAIAKTNLGMLNVACYTSFDPDGVAYDTSTLQSTVVSTEIPGFGMITGHGYPADVIDGEWRWRSASTSEKIDWEMPYDVADKKCHSLQTINKYKYSEMNTVTFPAIEFFIPVHFETSIYSLVVNVNKDVKFEWRDYETGKAGGRGEGTLTFASGDKCDLDSAFPMYVLNSFRGSFKWRCAARVVPGGSWVQFEGQFFADFGTNGTRIFTLDTNSDTEYNYIAGGVSVALTLKAGSYVDFDDQGQLKMAQLGKDAVLCSSSGQQRLFLKNNYVELDERGCVRSRNF